MTNKLSTLFVFIMDDKTYVSILDPRTTEPDTLELNSFVADYCELGSFSYGPVYNILIKATDNVVNLGHDW